MKNGKITLGTGIVVFIAATWFLFEPGSNLLNDDGGIPLATNIAGERISDRLALNAKVSFRDGESDADTRYLLEAFENRDEEELRRRVRELLEKDFNAALAIFAKLDYTLNHYNMVFPHDVVSSYLEEHYKEAEVMEILSEHINTSSILCSVMGVYFNKWLTRDHKGQFEWLKKNSSFGEIRVLAGYAESIGQFDKSTEVLQMIDTLSHDDPRKRELHSAVMNFVSGDNPKAFAKYLNSLDALPKEAMAPIYNLATQIIRQEDPEHAMKDAKAWIDLIADPKTKNQYLGLIAANYSFEHPEKFEQWFAEQKFKNEKERTEMRTHISQQVDLLERINTEESLEARQRLEQESPFGN